MLNVFLWTFQVTAEWLTGQFVKSVVKSVCEKRENSSFELA